jgi:hypothetical protein
MPMDQVLNEIGLNFGFKLPISTPSHISSRIIYSNALEDKFYALELISSIF